MKTLMSLLQNRNRYLEEIEKSQKLKEKIVSLFLLATTGFFLYGFAIGFSHSLMQSLSAAIKLPLLYLVTLLISYPTLFIFQSLLGSKRSPGQTLAVLLTATGSISLILLAFIPVVLFFLITTDQYQFFKLLNVSIFAISGIMGGGLLIHFYNQFPESDDRHRIQRRRLLQAWLFLYAFVGSQLGWTLRPFFGAPNLPFQFIREINGNFYSDIFRSILQILGVR